MEHIMLFILLLVTSSQCMVFTKEQDDQITNIVEQTMACHHIPGLTLSVVKGSSSWEKGFGIADYDTGRPVATSTLFSPGSLGKAFTMTLLATLLNDTSYTWSTKLIDIEGLNLNFISDTVTREATLADLLSHQTGLSDIVDFGFIAGYPEGTTKECLSRQLKYLPQRVDFRSDQFVYNNMMYMLLGQVIEVLGKDSFENLMTSRIFEPLGMKSSKILSNANDVLVGDVAKPYIKPEGEFKDGTPGLYKISLLEPAGGFLSNAEDMSKWLTFNLRNGTTDDGKQLVDPDLFAEAFENHRRVFSVSFGSDLKQPEFPVNDLTTGYGYAWFTSSYRVFGFRPFVYERCMKLDTNDVIVDDITINDVTFWRKMYMAERLQNNVFGYERAWHSGGLFAYVSQIWLFFDQELGIYINLNGPGTQGGPSETVKVILSVIADIALGLEPWLNTTTACTFPSPWRNSTAIELPKQPEYTNDHMEDFLGTYGNPLLPDITISLANGTGNESSKLELVWNRIKGDLRPTESPDEFHFIMTEPWEYATEMKLFGTVSIPYPVNFTRDMANEVQSFEFSLDVTAKMLFEKTVRFVDDCDISHNGLYTLGSNDVSSSVDLRPSHPFVMGLLLIAGFAITPFTAVMTS